MIIPLRNHHGFLAKRINGGLIIGILLNVKRWTAEDNRTILAALFDNADNLRDGTIGVITMSGLIGIIRRRRFGNQFAGAIEKTPFDVGIAGFVIGSVRKVIDAGGIAKGNIAPCRGIAWISGRADSRGFARRIRRRENELGIIKHGIGIFVFANTIIIQQSIVVESQISLGDAIHEFEGMRVSPGLLLSGIIAVIVRPFLIFTGRIGSCCRPLRRIDFDIETRGSADIGNRSRSGLTSGDKGIHKSGSIAGIRGVIHVGRHAVEGDGSGIEEAIAMIILAGEAATTPGLRQCIETRLGTPTRTANPFSTMSLEPALAPEALLCDAPVLLTACGLALRGFD